MLTSQGNQDRPDRRHGGRRVSLAELRYRLERPSDLENGHQQRLLDLAQRLGQVRAVGGQYARLELSGFVMSAMDRGSVAV